MADSGPVTHEAIARYLLEDVQHAVDLVKELAPETLAHLGAAVSNETRQRALADGDEDAVIAEAFDIGFGPDGLALLPWTRGPYVVCPGSIVSKSKTNHRCRFVSVDDTWIWESLELIREEKRSSPGIRDGFRAVALLARVEGMELDVVAGRARSGQHSVTHVVSYEIRAGELHEVSQRTVTPSGMQ